jgi:hypothetical protein
MRHITLALAAVACAAVATAQGSRTLDLSLDAKGITEVVIHAGVGEIEVLSDPGGRIIARVELKPKHFGIFSRHSDPDIENLKLEPAVAGGTLTLELKPETHDDRNFSESWTVRLPASLAATVKLGVGDVKVLDLASDIEVELGVGDVTIEGQYASFGSVHANCGVGDVSMRTPEGREEGEGFIAHTLHAKGPGKASIRASAGVGDVKIRLR